MESRSERRASLPSDLRPGAPSRAAGPRHSTDGRERKATPAEEAAAVRSAKQLHVHQPGIVFVPGAKLQVQETIDNNWYDCKVVEVDWGELDILVHYQRWSDRFDEWLKMDSPRIRPVPASRGSEQCPHHVGESVVALWPVDHRYYPATVTRVLSTHQCEVKFRDDNITKVLRCSQVRKITGKESALLLPSPPPPPPPAALPAHTTTTTTTTLPTSPPPAGTSKKNIFDVNICDQKRKPKRKAEYTEMLEGIHKRRSVQQGLITTRSSRLLLPPARVSPPAGAEAPATVAATSSAAVPSATATAAAVSLASTTAPAAAAPPSLASVIGTRSKFSEPEKVPPSPGLDKINLAGEAFFKSRVAGIHPANELQTVTQPEVDAEGSKPGSLSSVKNSCNAIQPSEEGLTVQPEAQLLETPKRAADPRPQSREVEPQQSPHPSKLSKPPPTLSNLASKLTIKKNKANKTPGSSKPSLLASLSTTRRAPMADDCMLSWEKHGCNVVKESAFPGWRKQYSRRLPYTGQDSWDVAYFAPDGSVLRNKRDLSAYAENNTLPSLVASFDFSAAGVKDAMLEHMKVCSVGTAKVGVSRTIAVPSSSAPLPSITPTLPMSPIKTRSGASHKKSDVLTPKPEVHPSRPCTPSAKSHSSTRATDLLEPEAGDKQVASSQETAPDESTPARDDSHKKLEPLQRPATAVLPAVPGRKATPASSRTASAVVTAGVDASHAATAAVLHHEELEAGVCSSDSDDDDDDDNQDVLSPQSQPNKLALAKQDGLDSPRSNTPTPDAPRRSLPLAPSGRFKIEIPISFGRETSEVEEATETAQPVAKPTELSPSPSASKPAPSAKWRLGASRRETKLAESPSVSLEEHVCVVKNCNKTFRKHSLLQMHLKHYHPGTGGRLGSVPNVADLAYARTAQGLLEPVTTPSADRRRKRHSLASLPESKRRKLEAVCRRKDAVEESDVGSVDTDSVDPRHADLAPDSDCTADQESLAGDSSSAAGLADNTFTVLDSGSDEDSDFVGFPAVAQTSTSSSLPSSQSLPPADTGKLAASADDGTTEESDEEATDVADEGDEVEVEDETGHRHIINCCCGSDEEDGLMLQCDVCMCWQHAQCYAIDKKAVPEKYVCSMCTNPHLVRSNHRFDHQVRNWLKEGAIPKFSFSCDDVGQGARLEACVQRGHELAGALLQHSHLLHAVSVTLAIAKKTDHPKLVMWHKKWSDPRPPGSVPSVLPLLPPGLQPFLPQVSAPLFPHSSSLTKDEAALIRDIIDMEPLISSDKILMPPDSMFNNVSPILPDSACIVGPPASIMSANEMPSDAGLACSSSFGVPRASALATFGQICEAVAFSTASLPSSMLENPVVSSTDSNVTIKLTPVCESNVALSESAGVSIASGFSSELSSVSRTDSLTVTADALDKLLSHPCAPSVFPTRIAHTSASSSIADSALSLTQGSKLTALPSSSVSEEVSSEISPAEISLTLPVERELKTSVPPASSPVASETIDSVSLSNSLLSCSSVLSVSMPSIPVPTTANMSTSDSSVIQHPVVSSRECISSSVLSSVVPGESCQVQDSSGSDLGDTEGLLPSDSMLSDSRKISDSNSVSNVVLKTGDLKIVDRVKENTSNDKLTVESSEKDRKFEGNTDVLSFPTMDFALHSKKLKTEEIQEHSDNNVHKSVPEITKIEALNANSSASLEVEHVNSLHVNLNEKEKHLPSFETSQCESSKVSPHKDSNLKLSKDGKSPDKKEVRFNLPLSLLSSDKDENSMIGEEIIPKSVEKSSVEKSTSGPDEARDHPLSTAIPAHHPSGAAHDTTTDALYSSLPVSVGQPTKADTFFATLPATEASDACPPSSDGTFSLLESNLAASSSSIKSPAHSEAPLADVPNSIPNVGEVQTTCPTLDNLNYVSNLETANNPEATNVADVTENLDLGDSADLDASDLALDLNELLLGNAAPLDQFGIPNLTPSQTSNDVPGPSVSFPEAERIEPVKCKLNLLSHVQAAQDTLERAYDAIEAEICKLENEMGITDTEEDSPGQDTASRQLVQMVLADMNIVERLALYTG